MGSNYVSELKTLLLEAEKELSILYLNFDMETWSLTEEESHKLFNEKYLERAEKLEGTVYELRRTFEKVYKTWRKCY